MDTWRALVVLMSDPARKSNPGRIPVYLLTGVANCGSCGKQGAISSQGAMRGKGKRYGCRSCHKVTRLSAPVDLFVLRTVHHLLERYQVKHTPHAVDISTDEEIAQFEQHIVSLRADKSLTVEELLTRLSSAQQSIRVLRAAPRVRLTKKRPAEGVTSADFLVTPADHKREIIADLLSVTLLPSGRAGIWFRPEFVQITMREHTPEGDQALAEALSHAAEEAGPTTGGPGAAGPRGPQVLREITCANCGKRVMTGNSRGRYCSQSCRYADRHSPEVTRQPREIDRICDVCGKPFKAAKRTARYCSSSCHSRAHDKRAAAGLATRLDRPFDRQCVMCGEGFQAARADAMYCSSTCRAAGVRARRADAKPVTNPGGGVKAMYPQKCDICEREYMSAKQSGPFYCQPTCRSTAYYRANRDKVLASRRHAGSPLDRSASSSSRTI